MQLPWFGKIAGKIVLARLPVPYAAWRRLGLFSPGAMLDPAYAFDVFVGHYERARSVRAIPPGCTGLELGPGDSLFGGLACAAHGARRTYLVDSADFASKNMPAYRAMMDYMSHHGLGDAGVDCRDFATIKGKFGLDYRVGGLASLREIPSSSVDFVWSHAVLEHVRLRDFTETCHQLHRVMRDDAVASHTVDLRDHLGGSLNNLRFAQWFWESPLMAGSGFYTNRIRYHEMLGIFERTGFEVASATTQAWDSLPIPRARLAGQFCALSDEDLKVLGFDVVLVRKSKVPGAGSSPSPPMSEASLAGREVCRSTTAG
jgi:hypothetical protein